MHLASNEAIVTKSHTHGGDVAGADGIDGIDLKSNIQVL
jgi:hypothetical protein